MKRFIGLLCLLLAPAAWATTTVTGKIQTLGAGNVTSGAFVRFWLRGCAGNQPRVNGTSVIGPTQGGVFFFDITADGSGNTSGTVYSTRDNAGTGNGDIECGGSKIAVWYGMQIFVAGKGGPETPVHAKSGATLDITQVTPITTNPVVTSPTGDTTYLRLDAGNSPVTGNLLLSNQLNLTNQGVFTNTQMNTYLTSMLNGQTPNMFHASGQPGYATEVLSVGAIVPSNATVQNIQGVGSYISSGCDSRIGGIGGDRLQCNGAAYYSDSLATANHAAVWGYNPVVHDNGANGTNLTGIELDMGAAGNPAFVQGIVIETTGSGIMPGGASAFLLNSAQGTWKFFEGYVTGRGALGLSGGVGLGVVLDGIGFGGSNPSASIAFTAYNAGNAARTASINADLNGNMILQPALGNAYSINNSGGGMGFAPIVFASLGTPANGNIVYCSDCTIANPCAGAGNGAFGKRLNGVWVCN